MDLTSLASRFSDSAENREKAIFSTLFIAGNRLQTLFDSRIPELSLKQFMLLAIVRQGREPLPLTRLGRMMGCSRQNIKKLAEALQKKGFACLAPSPGDARAICIRPSRRAEEFFQNEFTPYLESLHALFSVYTEDEIQTLFHLLSQLYAGIDRLEALPAHLEKDAAEEESL